MMADLGHAVVVGASGRVGSRLCERLREQGAAVTGVARFSDADTQAALEALGVQTIRFDVLRDDPATLPDADLLFLEIWDPSQHAGPDSREAIWVLNYDAVGRVVARYAGQADVINGCSGNVYGTSPDPRRETDPPRPDNEYGLARFAQERLIDFLCQQAGSRAVHLRYYHSNTPDAGLIRRLADAIAAEQSLGPNPDERVAVIGLEDFVRCTVLAAQRRDVIPPIVNVCHPRQWTRRELAERIQRSLGRGQVIFDREQGGREQSVVGDPTRMLEVFGPPVEDIERLIDRVCKAVNG